MSVFDACVKKVLAEFGEREVVDSSYMNMEEFILYGNRPEFDDDHILAVKFLISTDDSSDDTVETSWFVNPEYAKQILESLEIKSYLDTETTVDYLSAQAYGPQIASELLPELLL